MRALDGAFQLLGQGRTFDFDEPFLSPNPRFDLIDPGAAADRWCLAAAVEQMEKITHYSSFYTGESSLPRLEMFRDLGFEGPEMARRLELVVARKRGA